MADCGAGLRYARARYSA
jgi:hypothetical protein